MSTSTAMMLCPAPMSRHCPMFGGRVSGVCRMAAGLVSLGSLVFVMCVFVPVLCSYHQSTLNALCGSDEISTLVNLTS